MHKIDFVNLQWSDFYKSMAPVKPGFTAWQDVYKSHFRGIELYIKFQVGVHGELILYSKTLEPFAHDFGKSPRATSRN